MTAGMDTGWEPRPPATARRRWIGVALAVVLVGGTIVTIIVLGTSKGTGPGGSSPPSTGSCAAVKTKAKGAVSNPFGVVIPSPTLSPNDQVAIAEKLGVSYFRPHAVFLASGTSSDDAADFIKAGFRIVLTVRNGTTLRTPSTPPSSIDDYKKKIGQVIDCYHPALLVIENEENIPSHWSGGPDAYGQMLKAACEEAHAKQTKCTNGGLLSGAVTYMVYQHYVDTGQTAQAQSFASRAFENFQMNLLSGPNGAVVVQQRAEAALAYVNAEKTAGADYYNFHWYVADAQAMGEAAAYLLAVTGLPLVTNEMGQRDNDPATTTGLLSEVLQLKLPIAVWYITDARLARGLIDSSGALRPTGTTFSQFVKSHS